jgi:transposase
MNLQSLTAATIRSRLTPADFLSALNPKVVVLEPTGPYSKFAIAALEERGIPFLLVNLTMVRDTRKSFGGSHNKDDPFDSLLSTVIYYEKWQRVFDRRFWVESRHPIVRQIRTLLLDNPSCNLWRL